MNKTIPSEDPYRKRNEKLRSNPKCSRCGKVQTEASFYKTEVSFWCRECRRKYAKRLYHKRREGLSETEIKRLNDRINQRRNQRRKERLSEMTPEQLAEFRVGHRKYGKDKRDAVRDEAYKAYGGYICACCGESEPKFLSIDHVNNDGAKHKRENRIRTGEQMYRWLKRSGYPDGFQILCMNCNWGKRSNNGVCPHMGNV